MKYQTIVNLLDTASDNGLPRFVIKKWIEVHDQTGINCSVKTPMLRADLCDYYDTYIVVKGVITVTKADNTKRNKAVALKIVHYLSTAFQRLIMYWLTIQKG